jgi:hypothetical protein
MDNGKLTMENNSLYYFFHAGGPKNSLHINVSDCSAQRDFKGEMWLCHISPLKSLEGHIG